MTTEAVKVNGVVYPPAPLDFPESNTPQAGWMAITREVAERWLRSNRSNRGLRERHFAAHSRDMQKGKWAVNGETIKLSRPLLKGEVDDMPEGSILFLDGQHRLEACADSGQPFVTLVVWGLEPEARMTMDTGVSRTMNDVLKMDGETNAPVVASVLRRIWMLGLGDNRLSANQRPTHAELRELLLTDRDAFLRAAEKGYHVRTGFRDVSPAVVGTAYYLCYKASPEEAPEFFERFRDGVELPAGSPILALRNRLTKERAERRNNMPHYQIGLITKAWNHFRDNKAITKLQHTPDDPMPLPK